MLGAVGIFFIEKLSTDTAQQRSGRSLQKLTVLPECTHSRSLYPLTQNGLGPRASSPEPLWKLTLVPVSTHRVDRKPAPTLCLALLNLYLKIPRVFFKKTLNAVGSFFGILEQPEKPKQPKTVTRKSTGTSTCGRTGSREGRIGQAGADSGADRGGVHGRGVKGLTGVCHHPQAFQRRVAPSPCVSRSLWKLTVS